jgi:hypothetical protein
MNYPNIETGLSKYPEAEVSRYINYLKFLETDKDREGKIRNKWFYNLKEPQAIDIYKKVAIDGLSIDGETITIQFKGKITISYNYQAYKNRVLIVYPETKFDIQLVNKDDEFSFLKESGKVIYSHKITDPFNKSPEIIGTYCVIKNQRGEFLETLNMTEIQKMKNVAKTKNIWDNWFGEMILKSVIKRACKRHFRDITTNIDTIDNENNDLDRVNIDEATQKEVDAAKAFEDLANIYKFKKGLFKDESDFIKLLTKRRDELRSLLPKLTKDEHIKVVNMLRDGEKMNTILNLWQIDDETQQDLISQSII